MIADTGFGGNETGISETCIKVAIDTKVGRSKSEKTSEENVVGGLGQNMVYDSIS